MTVGSSDLPAWARIDYKFYFVSEGGDRACVGDSGAQKILSRDEIKERALLCRDKLADRFKQKFRAMTAQEVAEYMAEQKAASLANAAQNVKKPTTNQ